MKKRNQWLRAAAALIAGGWVTALSPVTPAMAGTLPSTDAPPVGVGGWVQVSTPVQLEYIDQNQNSYTSSNIELMNSIDLTGYQWTPLGITFSGTFNGQGHEIVGVVINEPYATSLGFFDDISGTVENLGLDAQVTGNQGPTMAGVLAGSLSGTGRIDNVHTSGSVSNMVGGVIDNGGFDGGLVGEADGGHITNSYSTASVNGFFSGGVVAEVINSSFIISDSYATGSVSAGSAAGGIIGTQSVNSAPGETQSVFFDTATTGVSVGVGSFTGGSSFPGISGASTSGMQTASTFTSAGWSTSNWTFYNGQYPLLSWQVPLTISTSASPTTVGPGGHVTVTGAVYSSGGAPLSGITVGLSDNAGGSWQSSSVTTDASGNYTDTWTAPNNVTTATVTASVYGTSVQQQSTIRVQAFTVAYNGNGNGVGSVPTDPNTYTSGMNATVLGNTGNLTKTGYTFVGWNTKADGSGTNYTANSTLTMPASNVTLYAQWLHNPTGLQHQNLTQTSWTESWTAVSGASSYDVYLDNVKVGTVTNTVYDFTGKKLGTTYTVQVSSLNASGTSALSAPDSVTTAFYGGGGPIPPFINTVALMQNAIVGQSYSAQLVTTGGIQPFQWSISNGSLPQGLSLNNQGIISGTPTGLGGQYMFTVKVTGANNLAATRQLTLTVEGPNSYPSITTTSLPPVTVGHSYHQALIATGGTVPYTWSFTQGTLPIGLSFNRNTGEISGTASANGVTTITVQVTDANKMTSTQAIQIDIMKPFEREIVWNGQIHNVPAVVGNDGGTQTTYMPIWYVMQLLKSMGIESAWNGHDWELNTSLKPNLLNIRAGTGSASIYLNGTLVQRVNTKVESDPSTLKSTTYMPLWYVQQILNRVGLTSTWNGTTWTVAKQNS